MRPKGEDDPGEVLAEARDRLRRSLLDLRSLEVGSVLQAQIIAELIDGPRTSMELVERILAPLPDDPREREACYARVRRAVKNLRARGYVATSLIRKNSPHRLTQFAIARLLQVAGGLKPEALVSRVDLALIGVSVALGLFGLGRYFSLFDTGELVTAILFSSFFMVSGSSLTRLIEALHKVM